MKTHYPKEYMAALLGAEGGYYGKRAYLLETAKLGIRLLGPDVNRSGFGFRAESEGIRIGLDAIRGTGPQTVAALLLDRAERGPFVSMEDLRIRMKARRIPETVLQTWIAAGACDSLDVNLRGKLAESEKRRMEKALLGFSPPSNPSRRWMRFAMRHRIMPIAALWDARKNARVRICGAVIQSRRQPTGTGDYMLSLILQDHTDMVEVVLSPETYRTFLYEINPKVILVEGILRTEDLQVRVVARKIRALGGS